MVGRPAGEDNAKIGSRIKKRRIELNMTQLDLSTLVGTSTRAIYDYETGKHLPRSDTLERIADALDTTPDALCGTGIINRIEPTKSEIEIIELLRQFKGKNRADAESKVKSDLRTMLTMLGRGEQGK